jgi:hypothetical protein
MKKYLFIATILFLLALPGVYGQEALPLGWHSTDIGAQDIPGSTTWDPEAELFTLESTGDQIFRPDNLHFAYTVQTGNFEIITLVSYVYGMSQMGYDFSPREEAGVMIREDLSPFSNTYYLSVQGGDKGGIRYYVRNNDDLEKMRHPGEGASSMTVPCWLKLKRIGNSFYSYYSQDGTNWIYTPEANRTIVMNPTCYAGIFCRGNANYVELFGWENPNNESIVSMVSEFEATRIEEIENIYTVQNPIKAHFVNINQDSSYIDVGNVFGRLESDEISYSTKSSDLKICRVSVLEESDSILVRPRGIGSCTMTLTGEVSSFNLVNKFPVFVWEAPEGWNSHDLGAMRTSGFVMKEGDLFTIGGSADASGLDLREGFHFMHRTLDGDVEFIAKISAAGFTTTGGLGGISFRADSTGMDAVTARVVYSGEGMARFETRTTAGDIMVLQAESSATVPCWIRMNKEGTLLNAYLSEDGEAWTALGTGISLDLGDTFEGGLMAGSSDNINLSMLGFEEVSLTHSGHAVNNPVTEQRMTVDLTRDLDISNVFGHPGGVLPVISLENSAPEVVSVTISADSLLTLNALSPGESMVTLSTGDDPGVIMTDFMVTVTEALEEDWMFADIGGALKEGYPANLGDHAYSISTFGTGISGVSDHCAYLYKEKTGAQQIVARIAAIEDRGSASQAGIMFRESTDPGSLYILYTATAYEGIKFKYRWDDDSQPVVEISNPAIEPPCWLKLKRDEFNYFSAAYSLDGNSWIPHGEFSVPLDLPPAALVGLTATSGFNEGTSWFDNVELSLATGVEEPENMLPVRVDHFPNPFTESATLRIDVAEQMDMQISLYNMAGVMVAELMNEQVGPGRRHIILDAAELPGGTYFYRVVTPDYVFINKIVKTR